MTDYNEIFNLTESTLRKYSTLSDSEFENVYGRFKFFENKKRTDDEYFEMLILIIFYSGFKASIVENKEQIILDHFSNFITVSKYKEKDISIIMSDSSMIRNANKIKACIANAKTFKDIVKEFGSFHNYIKNFEPDDSFENFLLLKEELEYRFEYLGGITVYHFLTDIGLNVLKPDRVICRIFKRLGLIENEKQLLKTVIHGKRFAKATNLPIRYIDIIFVKYGQQGESEMFGLKNGICLENNPNCKICELKKFCKESKNN